MCSGAKCRDIDECGGGGGGGGGCVGGVCTNTPGGHSCSCAPGFSLGADGRTCSDTGVLGLCYAAWGPGQCSNPSQVIYLLQFLIVSNIYTGCHI